MTGFRGWGWRSSQPPLGVAFGLNTQSPQAQGLVAWWPTLGSAGANVLRDLGGRGLNGVFPSGTADPTWAMSEQGIALQYDGVNDYVSVGDQSALMFSTQFTISAWVKINDFVGSILYNGIVGKGGVDLNSGYEMMVGNWTNILVFAINNNSTNVSNVLMAGQWQHLCCTFGSGRKKVYVDGIIKADDAYASPITSNSVPVWFGRRNDGNNYQGTFDGSISDIRIHNLALPGSIVYQEWDPATRWDLYRPLVRRVWHVPIAIGDGIFQRTYSPVFRGAFG